MNRQTLPSIPASDGNEDVAAALEVALRAGVETVIATFRSELARREKRPSDRSRAALARYRVGSWKHDVLSRAIRLTEDSGHSEFRFTDLARFADELRVLHREQKSTMSGINRTLQELVRDDALEHASRGFYRVV